MRASMRVRGGSEAYPINVKDISSTGMKASADVALFVGTRVELDLRNIGSVPGEVVWIGEGGQVGIRFATIIQPERIQTKVSGSYGPARARHSYVQSDVGIPTLRPAGRHSRNALS